MDQQPDTQDSAPSTAKADEFKGVIPLVSVIKPGLVLDLFTTAIEGGINYWAVVIDYHYHTTLNSNPVNDVEEFFAYICDTEDSNAPKMLVDKLTVMRGLCLFATTHPDHMRRVANEDYDASDADAIVQLGLFGKVIYA